MGLEVSEKVSYEHSIGASIKTVPRPNSVIISATSVDNPYGIVFHGKNLTCFWARWYMVEVASGLRSPSPTFFVPR